MIRVHDRNLEAARQVDAATQDLVPTCAPGTLPTDSKHLEAMFVFCTNNWRTYSGEKPTGKKLARINAIFKQATLGDCVDTEWSTTFEKTVLSMWREYKGTPAATAKRRFLTLLRDVDARLLQIKAYHFCPWGFPLTTKGERICPYSNARKGCPRPLMDKYGHNIEHELDHNEALADVTKLRTWLDQAAAQQRCSLGLHTSITKSMGTKFCTFFARPECGGFKPCTSTGLHKMVKKVLQCQGVTIRSGLRFMDNDRITSTSQAMSEVLTRQLMALVEMQNNPRKFSRQAQLFQRDRFLGLKQYYTSITGQDFTTEVSCSRDSHHCNTRRIAEGQNHTHPVIISTPPRDLSLYEPLIQVRRECERLGVPPMTGPVHSIDHRHRILQAKVVDFHRKKMLVYESQRRQQWRTDIAPHDAAMLKSFSRSRRSECLRHALIEKDIDCVCAVVESGADPCTELRGGMFPLMMAVLKRSVPCIQRLLAAGADIDTSNSRGMTSLMWAVKLNDFAIVDTLLDEGADVGLEGTSGWTAMSVAARHGRKEIAQLLAGTLRRDKIVGEMNAERALNHRSTFNGGLTPLAIAAIHRDEATARCIMRLGSNPAVKCHRGHVAGEHAMRAGWSVLALWLQETRAFGVSGVYAFTDMNAEIALRLANVRMLDAVSSGATVEEDMKKAAQQQNRCDGGDAAVTAAQSTRQDESEGVPVPLQPSSVGSQVNDSPNFWQISNIQLDQVRSNTVLTVKILQEGHAAPDTETDSGHTALISAAYRGRATCVRLLIQEGADPNYSNRFDRTALMAAAAAGHHKIVVALLAHGADAAWLDMDGKTAGAYAYERNYYQLSELLAIASSQGREAALDWEADRRHREETERERHQMETVLKTAGGGGEDVPEEKMFDWMNRVTIPKEAARRADGKTPSNQTSYLSAARLEGGQLSTCEESGRSSSNRDGNRCPKCTLSVPCLHFASLERLRAEFPEGTPEWEWKKVGANCSAKRSTRGNTSVRARHGGEGGSTDGDEDVAWWKPLYKAHRDRVLPTQEPEEDSSSKPARDGDFDAECA